MKILHLSFHKGCINDFNSICKILNIECEILSHVKEWNTNKDLQTLAEYSNQHYNINHALAEKYWNRYKDYFNEFDAIITSDTAPLSRIFLQNNWDKKLIIWICNRFNYSHKDAYSPPDFPDKEYYDLFRKATTIPNVKIVGYTKFESIYCKKFNIDFNNIIKPCGILECKKFIHKPNYNDYMFVIPYHNENIMMDLTNHLLNLNIKAISSKYDGVYDLKNYKAIIHIPYATSNLALFEGFQAGLIYFIPSFAFLLELFNKYSNNFFPNKDEVFLMHTVIEWYDPEYKDIFIYFDSWEDFVNKYNTLDYNKHQERVLEYGKYHKDKCLTEWNKVIYS